MNRPFEFLFRFLLFGLNRVGYNGRIDLTEQVMRGNKNEKTGEAQNMFLKWIQSILEIPNKEC